MKRHLLSKILLLFILNLSIISCGEEINSQYREIKLPKLKILSFNMENKNIDITSNLEIKFNTFVSIKSLYKGISCSSGSNTAFLYLYLYHENDRDTVKLIPYYPFIPYVKYTCYITTDVTDIYNEPIDKTYNFTFKTNNRYYTNKTFNKNSYSFNNVYQFLQRRCSSCHNQSNKLNFKTTKKKLYNFLVKKKNIKSNKYYIKQNDTENSYLINKLMGINFYDSKMPPKDLIPLYELEKIIGWVKTGAKYE